MKVWQLATDDGSPYAILAMGHLRDSEIGDLLRQENASWSGGLEEPVFTRELTRHEWAIPTGIELEPFRLHRSPKTLGVVRVTLSYWEEPMPDPEAGEAEEKKA